MEVESPAASKVADMSAKLDIASLPLENKTCTSLTRIPRALQITSESRTEAKMYYKLSFASTIGDKPAKIWFDHSIDIFYLDEEMLVYFNALSVPAIDLPMPEQEMLDTTADLDSLRHIGLQCWWLFDMMDSPVNFPGALPIKAFKKFGRILGVGELNDCESWKTTSRSKWIDTHGHGDVELRE